MTIPSLPPILTVILNASWHASILAILVLAFQFLARRRLPARWRFALWLLVLIRLSAIPLPESRLSIFNLLPESTAQGSANPPTHEPAATTPIPTNAPLPHAAVPIIHHTVPWPNVLTGIYAAGVSFILLHMLIASHQLRKILRRAKLLTDADILRSLDAAQSALSIRRPIPILIADDLAGPALVGLIRPRLILPQRLLSTLTPRDLHFIFLHECVHLRRYDILTNYWLALLAALHWFNPFVWLLLPRIRADRELACDEQVMLHTGDNSTYGHTLLKLIDTAAIRPTLACPAAVGIIETKSLFKRRIHMIAAFRRPPTWIAVPAFAMLILIATATLTSAISVAAEKAHSDVPDPPAYTTQPVDAGTKLLETNMSKLSFDQLPVENVFKFLADSTGANIVVNWKALEPAGVDKNVPITMNVTNIPMRKALSIVLAQMGPNVDYAFNDNVLTISTTDDLKKEVVIRVYNVRDLLERPSSATTGGSSGASQFSQNTPAVTTEPADDSQLPNVITSTVEPSSWICNGGAANSIVSFHGLFTITATPDVHQKIANLLATLRAADKEQPR